MSKVSNQNRMAWIIQPGSWISLSALAVSIGTFFMVYGNPGELKVTMPSEIGMRLTLCEKNICDLELLVPIVFTNTGAQRMHRQIITVFAEIKLLKKQTPIKFRWKSEWQFMGKLDFNKTYPDKGEPGVEDYIVYVGRAAPFNLGGGKSVVKLLKLHSQYESIVLNSGLQESFNLQIKVDTEQGTSGIRQNYICKYTVNDKKFVWCEMYRYSLSGV